MRAAAAAAAAESTMRHRLRARPKAAAAAGSVRSRRRMAASRETPAPGERSAACDGDLLTELSQLLSAEEEEAGPWWEEAERQEDSSLSDLLVQLVAANDCSGPEEASSSARGSAAGGRCVGNKNAVAARLNRLRKKEYISGLESRVTRLSDENARLEQERRALRGRVRELEAESRYLRAVLANDSALSQLLSRLTGLGGVQTVHFPFRDPSVKPDDHDYALPSLIPTQEEEEELSAPSAGVCLHVDKEKVSVEDLPGLCKERGVCR